jgi:hypothetical protein
LFATGLCLPASACNKNSFTDTPAENIPFTAASGPLPWAPLGPTRAERTYLYDYQTGNADQLHIATDHDSLAFANPTITNTVIARHNAILVTLFIPSEKSGSGEAGELIY